MRQLIIAALLCTFGACSCGTGPCVSTSGGTGGFGGSGTTSLSSDIGFVGKAVTVELDTPDTFSSCSGQLQTVTSVDAEVLDPANDKVAATVTGPTETPGLVSATVTFTPAVPGPYHVTARFLPGASTVQKDILVAIDNSNAMAQTALLDPAVAASCLDIDIDPGTPPTVLCKTQDSLVAMQNGTTTASVSASAFSLSQSRVWVFGADGDLHVYGVGSNGTLNPLASMPLGLSPSLIVAKGDSALLLAPASFVQTQYASDGGLSMTSPVYVTSAAAAQWVPGVGLQLFDNAYDDICSYSLAQNNPTLLNGELDGAACTGSSGVQLVAYDDDGLWALDLPNMTVPDLQTLEVTGWQAGQTRSNPGSLSFVSPNPPPMVSTGFSTPGAVSPLLYSGGQVGNPTDLFLPHFDGSVVTLTRFPLVSPSLAHADSKRLWLISNNTLTWWPR